MPDTPIFKIVRRTWWERLFTIPWRPLQATRQERDWKAELAHARHATVKGPKQLPPYIRSLPRESTRPPPPPPPPATSPRRVSEAPAPAADDSLAAYAFLGAAAVAKASRDTSASDPTPEFKSGGGGEFAGGGASGSWDDSSSNSSDSGSSSSDSSGTSSTD